MSNFNSFEAIPDNIRYLSIEELMTINSFLIEAQTPSEPTIVLKENELASSQNRSAQFSYYNDTEDMFKLAASLIESLILNHPFANANKRTAFMAGYIFLLLNGYELNAPEDEILEIIVGIAAKKYNFDELQNWLCYWSKEYDTALLSITDLL